jgi:hypothetical protein
MNSIQPQPSAPFSHKSPAPLFVIPQHPFFCHSAAQRRNLLLFFCSSFWRRDGVPGQLAGWGGSQNLRICPCRCFCISEGAQGFSPANHRPAYAQGFSPGPLPLPLPVPCSLFSCQGSRSAQKSSTRTNQTPSTPKIVKNTWHSSYAQSAIINVGGKLPAASASTRCHRKHRINI